MSLMFFIMCNLNEKERKSIMEQWENIKLGILMKMRGLEVKESKKDIKLNTSTLKPTFESLAKNS